jgi:DNA-binding beta-propeller fold protein YncE
MKYSGLNRYALTIGAASALLAGCGGSQPPISAPGAVPQISPVIPQAARGKSRMLPEVKRRATVSRRPLNLVADYLFVANEDGNHKRGSISIYRTDGLQPVRKLRQSIKRPIGLALDEHGNVYVADSRAVTVFEAGTGKLLERITDGISSPEALAFDSSGHLYVANFAVEFSSITVYAPGMRHVLRTITEGIDGPDAMAFDSAGNLYVANFGPTAGSQTGTVTEYAADSVKLRRTITAGIVRPSCLLFDASGRLYVSSGPNFTGHGAITVYSPRKLHLLRTITNGLVLPIGLAFDKNGELYVANAFAGSQHTGSVVVYPRGKSTPAKTITSGIDGPTAILFDGSGDLFVANGKACTPVCDHGFVSVYAAKSTKLIHEITDGIDNAVNLALGPNH